MKSKIKMALQQANLLLAQGNIPTTLALPLDMIAPCQNSDQLHLPIYMTTNHDTQLIVAPAPQEPKWRADVGVNTILISKLIAKDMTNLYKITEDPKNRVYGPKSRKKFQGSKKGSSKKPYLSKNFLR